MIRKTNEARPIIQLNKIYAANNLYATLLAIRSKIISKDIIGFL